MSRVYVFYDGFRYGQSYGIRYDPTIVVPCDYVPDTNGGDPPDPEDNDPPLPDPNDGNIISFGNFFLGFFAISIIALAIVVKKRTKTKKL